MFGFSKHWRVCSRVRPRTHDINRSNPILGQQSQKVCFLTQGWLETLGVGRVRFQTHKIQPISGQTLTENESTLTRGRISSPVMSCAEPMGNVRPPVFHRAYGKIIAQFRGTSTVRHMRDDVTQSSGSGRCQPQSALEFLDRLFEMWADASRPLPRSMSYAHRRLGASLNCTQSPACALVQATVRISSQAMARDQPASDRGWLESLEVGRVRFQTCKIRQSSGITLTDTDSSSTHGPIAPNQWAMFRHACSGELPEG